MVEDPEPTQYVAVSTIEPEASAPPAYSVVQSKSSKTNTPDVPMLDEVTDTEILAIQNRPVTSSIRTTLLHLRNRAGYWSRFRGMSLFICFILARGLIVTGLTAIPALRSQGGIALATVVAEIILARWQLTWIHIVISEPRPGMNWYQRLPPLRTSWPRIAPAIALQSVVLQVVQIFPMLVCRTFGPMKHLGSPGYEPRERDVYAVTGQATMALFLILMLSMLLGIPATVTTVRVAASMLPEEDETIVPFDRSFGGKVTPAIIGGSGKIGMIDAWKSFNWASRKRLLKLIVKVFVILFALGLMAGMIMVGEAKLLLGDKMKEIMRVMHGH